MSRTGPCLCGDTECPWCGPLQGGPEPPEEEEIDSSDYEDEMDGPYEPDEIDDYMTDIEADADTLRSVGWGTDEDYRPDDPDTSDFDRDF